MIKKLRFVSIAVPNLDEAATFWRETVGLPMRGDWDLAEPGLRVARFGAGDTELALLQPTNPDGPVSRFLDQRGAGLYHLSFEVDDIELALRTFLARGAELVDREPRDGPDGRIAFVRSSAMRGVIIELWEPKLTAEPSNES